MLWRTLSQIIKSIKQLDVKVICEYIFIIWRYLFPVPRNLFGILARSRVNT